MLMGGFLCLDLQACVDFMGTFSSIISIQAMVAWWPPDFTITSDSAAQNYGEQIEHSCWGDAHLDIYTFTAQWICACGGVYIADIRYIPIQCCHHMVNMHRYWWIYYGCIYGLSISIPPTTTCHCGLVAS